MEVDEVVTPMLRWTRLPTSGAGGGGGGGNGVPHRKCGNRGAGGSGGSGKVVIRYPTDYAGGCGATGSSYSQSGSYHIYIWIFNHSIYLLINI